ncbi:hypothetical protein [Flavobacterium reichenbachii]|uniref:Uncharacterized protein n=1 Tax=Flavobacterium reichenbachii TaxID=362418 RepID=A0A085ZQ50_9FLAO|nr:hypothetical protein [Flavobacterium reichenbachii]KFF06564.1 hypothetical protein IW19_14065 [Flavobacterium reichenbachii]OXB18831.1 hypothetical protein B0A68_02125 [Flavobacterium reichenbachii]
MEHKFNDWAMYLNVCASYSETFRQEMAVQLLEEFYRLLEFESPCWRERPARERNEMINTVKPKKLQISLKLLS